MKLNVDISTPEILTQCPAASNWLEQRASAFKPIDEERESGLKWLVQRKLYQGTVWRVAVKPNIWDFPGEEKIQTTLMIRWNIFVLEQKINLNFEAILEIFFIKFLWAINHHLIIWRMTNKKKYCRELYIKDVCISEMLEL